MPAPAPLTPEQTQRIEAGLCGCGCGDPLLKEQLTKWHTPDFCSTCDPSGTKKAETECYGCSTDGCDKYCQGAYAPAGEGAPVGRWAGSKCRQRAYRQRVQAGTVRTKLDRQRTAELARATQLEQEAEWSRKSSQRAADDSIRKAKEAKSIRDRWEANKAGQLPLSATKG